MKVGAYLVAGALLASAAGAAAATPAARPVWDHGYLTCPDGSIGKPAIMPHYPPTAQDLANTCALRAENKRMRDTTMNRPLPTTSPEELRRQAANLIGPSR